MLECLCDQNPVKGVTVERRQPGEVDEGCLVNRQARDLMSLPLPGQVVFRRRRQRQFAPLVLDDRLPHGRHAQVNRVGRVLDGVAQGDRQATVPADEPQEDVRVQQEPHCPSNSRRTSSGSGWSKSSGTVNSPAQSPKGRGCRVSTVTGLISATGWPSRTTKRVSPASTRCRQPRGSRWISWTLMLVMELL